MNKKAKLLIFLGILFIVSAIGIGIFLGLHDTEPDSNTSSSPPYTLFISSWIPIMAAIFISSQPTTPVQNLVTTLANKKLSAEKKVKNIDYYITKDFKSSDNYSFMLTMSFEKSKKVEVKEKGTEMQIISVDLINGNKYDFEVIKRTKENALTGTCQWLVNNLKKYE